MGPEVESDDDFRTLELEPGAKASEVKQAYRRLAKKWHPDRHQLESYETRALAEEKFRQIDEAYRRILRRRGKSPHLRRPAPGDFSAVKPAAAPVPETAFGFKHRLWSVARRLSRTRPNLSLAAAALIFIFFFALLSNTGPEGPIRVKEKIRRHPPTEKRHVAAPRPGATDSRSPLRPAPPKSLAASPGNSFTLGSSASEVMEVQGMPTRIQGETWFYGVSEVHFKNGGVCGYNNFDGSLRVKMDPGVHEGPSPAYITIGSNEQQVLLVQGTPTRIDGNRWYYGFAELIFKGGLVRGYDNYFGTLKMRLLPSTRAGHGERALFFSKGSTPDEVLAVQGTPTAVNGNRWSYNFDFVFFRHGKVRGVVDADGALRFAGGP